MDLKGLELFVEAAAARSLRAAARDLFLSQPAATARIHLLEEELGASLFDRPGRGRRLVLTAAGERFLPVARRIVETYRDGLEEVRAWQEGYTARLRIASSVFVAAWILPASLRAFARRYPEVEVDLWTGRSREVLEQIRTGEAHLGFTRLPPQGEGVEGRPWHREPVVLVAPPDAEVPFPHILRRYRLLSGNHPGYWEPLLSTLRRQGIPFRTMPVSMVEVTKRLIQEGLGVSFLPESAVQAEIRAGTLKRVDAGALPLPETGTYLALPQGRPVLPHAEAFLEVLGREGLPGEGAAR